MLQKRELKKYIFFLLSTFLFVSCTTDNDSLAFVIPDNQAEVAELELSTQTASTSFYYSLLAKELIIEWGDKTRTSEYVYPGDGWSSIRPIVHLYAEPATYLVNVRTNSPLSFDFSRNDSTNYSSTISKINLTNCYTLSELYCRNQPISDLDLSSCNNLSVLDIANASVSNLTLKFGNKIKNINISNTSLALFDAQNVPSVESLTIGTNNFPQDVANIESLRYLKLIYIDGKISKTNLDLSTNDSLQIVQALNANIQQLNLEQLNSLNSLSLTQCRSLQSIKIASNSKLSQITLVDNISLSASAIDSLFSRLPLITDRNGTILLSGNAGDNACDRSIATARGWTFR